VTALPPILIHLHFNLYTLLIHTSAVSACHTQTHAADIYI